MLFKSQDHSSDQEISSFYKDHQEELDCSTGLSHSSLFMQENFGTINGVQNNDKGVKRSLILENQDNKLFWENFDKEITDASKNKIKKISVLAKSDPQLAFDELQSLEIRRKFYTLEIRKPYVFDLTKESNIRRFDCDAGSNGILVSNRKNIYMIEYYLEKGYHNCQTLYPFTQDSMEISCVKFLSKLNGLNPSQKCTEDIDHKQFAFGNHFESNIKIVDLQTRNLIHTFDYSQYAKNVTTQFIDSNEDQIVLVDDKQNMRIFDIRQKQLVSSNEIFNFTSKNNDKMSLENDHKATIVNQIELCNNTVYMSSTIGPLIFDIRGSFESIIQNFNEEPVNNIGGFIDENAEFIFTCFYDDNFIDVKSTKSCETISTLPIPRSIKDVCYCKSTNEMFVLCSGPYNAKITKKYKKHTKQLNCENSIEQVMIFKVHVYDGKIKLLFDDFIELLGDFECFKISVNTHGQNLVVFGEGICSVFERDQKDFKTKIWKKVVKSLS